jgi:hypothetical protein
MASALSFTTAIVSKLYYQSSMRLSHAFLRVAETAADDQAQLFSYQEFAHARVTMPLQNC